MWENCFRTISRLSRYFRTGVGTAPGPLCEAVLKGTIKEARLTVGGRATEVV